MGSDGLHLFYFTGHWQITDPQDNIILPAAHGVGILTKQFYLFKAISAMHCI